jgi:AraC family transcriptional activator of pyochelin receptor
MKIVYKSEDIKEIQYTREYTDGYSVPNRIGLAEYRSEFDYGGIHSRTHRIHMNGIFMGMFQVTHERAFTQAIESDFPYLQMHFELTTGGCVYEPNGRFEPDTNIMTGRHSLLFYPALKGELTYLKTPFAASVEIELSLDFLRKLFNQELGLLGTFGTNIEQNLPAIMGNRSYPITPQMKQILSEMRACPYAGVIKRIFLEAKVCELLTLQIDQMTAGKTIQSSLKKADVYKLHEGFKEVFKNTVFGYLTDQRMERAKDLIMNGQYETIAEVSNLIGYKNHQHFTVAFKKKFGYLPRELKG